MEHEILYPIGYFLIACGILALTVRFIKNGFFFNLCLLAITTYIMYKHIELALFFKVVLYGIMPLTFINVVWYAFLEKEDDGVQKENKKFRVSLKTKGKKLILKNIRRGISIIGSAGSGKTESIVHKLLQHLAANKFSGVLHDYKDFEITEMCYPLFKNSGVTPYIVSFDPIYHSVNPIAPKYLKSEESVHEVSRVLVENLLELKESGSSGSSRFFNDAVEGLISGMIWRLRTDYKKYCTLPHLIALYQRLSTKELIDFLSVNTMSRAMADAFISGVGSERQTAGVKSTLANAFKKITTRSIFMALSKDEVPLDVNNPKKPTVVSIVNNPNLETSLSPVIATIIHTITKQMAKRNKQHSFLLMEEASTLRLLNMHRIPATLRSYDISTIYILQDKIQNDMLYGDKASKAILSNLSYQFFGKANDPDTAKYYERFFEIVKRPTKTVSGGLGIDFDTRISKGEKEVAKTRADEFYALKQGEFMVLYDGKDRKVQFRVPKIERGLPKPKKYSKKKLKANFEKIYKDVIEMFESQKGDKAA